MDVAEFRRAAKEAIDQIADYHESVPSRPVLADVQPGYLRLLLPSAAPDDPEPFADILADLHAKIVPGITHWRSPGFMAFFPCSASYPADIAEMWSNAFNGAHFNWICSPAVTELETITLDWLARALGLPACFLSDGPGGGVIHGSASEALLTVMVAARDKFLAARTAHLPDGEAKDDETARLRGRLVALGSAGAHSSTRKAARILGLRFRAVPVSERHHFAMRADALARTLDQLAADRLEPFFLTATLGTTDVCAVDDFSAIADTLAPRAATARELWVHVDAAYAGSALLLPENQPLLASPCARFHSFNFNPHKWMLTTFDCSALWVRDRAHLIDALSIKPAYLRNQFSDGDLVTDYRDWQIPLGRRFRSLKLWVVLRAYGLRGLRDHVGRGIARAEELEAKLRRRPHLFVIFTPARFALVTLRVCGVDREEMNARTETLHERINASGTFYLTSTLVAEQLAIRVCTAGTGVTDAHVQALFDALVQEAEKLVGIVKGDVDADSRPCASDSLIV